MSNSHLDPTPSEERSRLFVETWTRHLAAAVNSLLGGQLELLADGKPALASPNCWFHHAFPPLEGSFSLGLERDAVISIGAGLLKASGEEEPPERAIQSFVEMLGQAAAGTAVELSARSKYEVRAAGLTPSEQPPPRTKYEFQLRLALGDSSYPLSAVVEGTELLLPFGSGPPLAPACPMPANAPAASVAVDSIAVNTRNLDLLLDVELPISVSFGRAQLPLKDVIKLTTGSIVELNRSISEPVDIIVNNCIIARGEVVVVEGNFGVRIKQIVSKQERLRSVA